MFNVSASGRRVRIECLLRVATLAALLASAGDILMLLVANGQAFAAGTPIEGPLLAVGGGLGFVAIPLYYVGYHAAANVLRLASFRRRLCTLGALMVAAFGAITHALTAADIQSARVMGLSARPPAEAFADLWSPLSLAALIAAMGALLAAGSFVGAGLRNHSADIKLAVLFNPIVSTLILAAAATVSESTTAYVAPSAPNLAHFFFFALLTRASARHTNRA